MAFFSSLALLGIGLAAGKLAASAGGDSATDNVPNPNGGRNRPVLAPGETTNTAVPRDTTIGGGVGPKPPDAGAAASSSALAAQAASMRQKNIARGGAEGTILTGNPGASTPKVKLQPRTLLGY